MRPIHQTIEDFEESCVPATLAILENGELGYTRHAYEEKCEALNQFGTRYDEVQPNVLNRFLQKNYDIDCKREFSTPRFLRAFANEIGNETWLALCQRKHTNESHLVIVHRRGKVIDNWSLAGMDFNENNQAVIHTAWKLKEMKRCL